MYFRRGLIILQSDLELLYIYSANKYFYNFRVLINNQMNLVTFYIIYIKRNNLS